MKRLSLKILTFAFFTLIAVFLVSVIGAKTAFADGAKLVDIYIDKKPIQNEYAVGDTLKPDGMVVVARYNDNTKRVVTDKVRWILFSSDAKRFMYAGKDVAVIVSYSEGGQNAITTFGVDVYEKTGAHIDLKTNVKEDSFAEETLNKDEWFIHEQINPTESSSGCKAYRIRKTDNTAYDMQGNIIEGLYTWMYFGDGYIPPLKRNLTSIEVVALPNKSSYHLDDCFDPQGMVIVAHYDDGTSREITNYTYDKRPLEKFRCIDFSIHDISIFSSNSNIEIIYTEDGIRVNTFVPIKIYRSFVFWI